MLNIFYFFAGIILVIAAALLGLYIGVYILMYKTVVIFLADPGFWALIWGLIKWGLAGVIGWGSFAFAALPGIGLIARALR